MKIKVCGLKYPDNMAQVSALSPDYMGFICYGLSPRFINDTTLTSLREIPADIHATAVFVNEKADVITKLISDHHFDTVQLHGTESSEFCQALRKNAIVIKAFGIDENFDFNRLNEYQDAVDFFLFDTKTKAYGGSGEAFNWQLLDQYQSDMPFFLSGGISLANLAQIKQIKHPQFYGIDLNSRFETEPGIKDIPQLREAFNTLNDLNKINTNGNL